MEDARLLRVLDTGSVLVLLDGRRLRVHFKYTHRTCAWPATSRLQIEDGPRGVIVTNLDDNEKVTADWESRNGEEMP